MRRALLLPLLLLPIAACAPSSDAPERDEPRAQEPRIELSPATASEGVPRSIRVWGAGTDWAPGEVSVDLGAGVAVESVRVVSSHALELLVLVLPGAELGARDVFVRGAATEAVLRSGFAVETGSLSLSPGTIHLGETLRLTVLGQGTAFDPAATTVSFGADMIIDELEVLGPEELAVTVHQPARGAPGPRDLVVAVPGVDAWTLDDALLVDRVGYAFRVVPDEANQGTRRTVRLYIDGVRANDEEPELDLGTGVVVEELSIAADGLAEAVLRIGNNARVGPRTVSFSSRPAMQKGRVERRLVDGFTIHPVDADPEDVRVSLSFSISHSYDQGSCAWRTFTIASALFYEPNDFPCPSSGASSDLTPPPRYDQIGTGFTTPAEGATDCPSPKTFDAGPVVRFRPEAGPDVELDRDVNVYTGRVSYRSNGLLPTDYPEDTWFDLVTPGGDRGNNELPPWTIEDALVTLPVRWRQLGPDWCGLSHPVQDDLVVRWEAAGTYDTALMTMSLGGTIQDEGYPVVLTYPWDDGEFAFEDELLEGFLGPGAASLSQVAMIRNRFEVPGASREGAGFAASSIFFRSEFELR